MYLLKFREPSTELTIPRPVGSVPRGELPADEQAQAAGAVLPREQREGRARAHGRRPVHLRRPRGLRPHQSEAPLPLRGGRRRRGLLPRGRGTVSDLVGLQIPRPRS